MLSLNDHLKPALVEEKSHDVSVLRRFHSVAFTGDMKRTFL